MLILVAQLPQKQHESYRCWQSGVLRGTVVVVVVVVVFALGGAIGLLAKLLLTTFHEKVDQQLEEAIADRILVGVALAHTACQQTQQFGAVLAHHALGDGLREAAHHLVVGAEHARHPREEVGLVGVRKLAEEQILERLAGGDLHGLLLALVVLEELRLHLGCAEHGAVLLEHVLVLDGVLLVGGTAAAAMQQVLKALSMQIVAKHAQHVKGQERHLRDGIHLGDDVTDQQTHFVAIALGDCRVVVWPVERAQLRGVLAQQLENLLANVLVLGVEQHLLLEEILGQHAPHEHQHDWRAVAAATLHLRLQRGLVDVQLGHQILVDVRMHVGERNFGAETEGGLIAAHERQHDADQILGVTNRCTRRIHVGGRRHITSTSGCAAGRRFSHGRAQRKAHAEVVTPQCHGLHVLRAARLLHVDQAARLLQSSTHQGPGRLRNGRRRVSDQQRVLTDDTRPVPLLAIASHRLVKVMYRQILRDRRLLPVHHTARLVAPAQRFHRSVLMQKREQTLSVQLQK
mmetsp:Transcript_1233/g.3784  ORF Transcript_1233/g.3784 Transcript_1233/m.3784 type:complete len:516 (-) Transcript_1233:2338-3885(-)